MARKKVNKIVDELVEAITFFKELQSVKRPGVGNPKVSEILLQNEKILQDELFEALRPKKD